MEEIDEKEEERHFLRSSNKRVLKYKYPWLV